MKQSRPLTYLITQGNLTTRNFPAKSSQTISLIEQAVSCGISLIQIREKKLPARLIFQLTAAAVRLAEKSATGILVNDRADIALAAKAAGVHLTANSIPAKIIRQNFPANFLIGVSAHSLQNILRAEKEGADFAVLGPVFASPGKGKPRGIKFLRSICEQFQAFPIIALGGISETNYHEVLAVADGMAAIRFLNNPKNLQKLRNEDLSQYCRN